MTTKWKVIWLWIVFIVAATGYAIEQRNAISTNTEQIKDIKSGMKELITTLRDDHEQIHQIHEDQRVNALKLDYLISGRRGLPPSAANP